MHSATSSEHSQLVRIVVPCAQTRVAIETHSRWTVWSAANFEKPAEQATKPRAKQEARSVLCHTCTCQYSGGRFDIWAERERCHCMLSSSSCCWPAVRGVAYATIGSKFPPLSYSACTNVHCTNGQCWHAAWGPGILLDFLGACYSTSHDCDIKHTYVINNENFCTDRFFVGWPCTTLTWINNACAFQLRAFNFIASISYEDSLTTKIFRFGALQVFSHTCIYMYIHYPGYQRYRVVYNLTSL